MQYDAKTPEEYLNMLEDDWRREKLEELRAIIKAEAPHFEECINYKMLGYRDAQDVVFHLNAQRGYVSFYVGDIKKIDPSGELLAGINMGKGCVRFTKSKVVSETRIREFISKAVEMRKLGEDFDC